MRRQRRPTRESSRRARCSWSPGGFIYRNKADRRRAIYEDLAARGDVMLRFWQNPEFVRHRRSELRRPRALAVVVLVVVICLLVGLACWIREETGLEEMRHLTRQWDGHWNQLLADRERRKVSEFWQTFYQTLIYIQAGIVTFWSLLSCAQSISREREHKTWDFQRITRMTPTEMVIGKL